MAFWDDPQMVINHIRHSCVTSDDTGMCEMVIVRDEPEILHGKQKRRLLGYHSDEGSDYSDYSQSFDIAVSPGIMGRTPKNMRQVGIRKSRQEHHCKTIHWSEKSSEMTEDDREDLFQKKNLDIVDGKASENFPSLLSQLLQDSSHQPNNVFVEYAKFNGEGLEDTCPTKSLQIFLSFLPNEDDRLEAVPITVLETACVQDIIGLVLYKYTLEGRRPRVQNDVKAYALYIAEDDGEVEMDFPALDEKDLISKFGFVYLAVVEKHKPNKQPQHRESVVVKVHITRSGYSTVKVDRTDVKMKQIFAKIVQKRKLKRSGRDFHLETDEDPGKAIDLESTLESQGTYSFNLVKQGEAKETFREDKDKRERDTNVGDEIIGCLWYKAFRVQLFQRLLVNTEVNLGIDGRKIEIDPVAQSKSSKFWARKIPVSLDIECVVDSEITEVKPSGRKSFRIYYKRQNHDDYKHYDLEAPSDLADEIVNKINNILNTRNPLVRNEYKERKTLEKGKRH